MTFYLLDTNAVSDMIAPHPQVFRRATESLAAGDILGLCYPVHYEVLRGLLWKDATKKLFVYQQRIVPLLTWIDMDNAEWDQAAYFWADARQRGKQLSDPDLLLAAVAHRYKAIVVSSDGDFDALSIQSENWRLDKPY